MAKTDSRAPAHARPLGRFRLRVVSYYRRDGKRIVRSWPKKRAGDGPTVVKAWQEDMKLTVSAIKSMAGCTTKFAEDVTPRSGYSMYDWLNAMFHGRGLRHIHPNQSPNRLPELFRDPPLKMFEGAPRVLTPTCQVNRSSFESLTNGVFKKLTPNTEVWDTNDFWRSTPNPSRLTVRAAGLYLVCARVEYNAGWTGDYHVSILLNNATTIGYQVGRAPVSYPPIIEVVCFRYFNPDDYIEVQTVINVASKTAKLTDFTICAITPEAIY